MAPNTPHIPPIPQSPFDNPAKHNRELEAKRQSEAAAARAEAELLARKRLQDIQNNPDMNFSEFPTGFAIPPAPQVGEHTEGTFPNGKMPVIPPEDPTMSMQEIMERRAREDAEMLEAIEAQRKAAEAAPQGSVKPPSLGKVNPKATLPPVNPILRQLRLDFGIDTQKTIDLKIADHVWSFYPLSPEMTTLALRIAEMGSDANTERMLLQQYAAVCCSVVAIDNEPLWKVFSIEVEKGDDISQPLNPKGRVRQRAALALLQELMTNSKLGVMQKLIEAYEAEVDPSGVVKGYTDYTSETYYRFTCPVKGCNIHIVRSKRFDDQNKELSYFCEQHGEVMDSSPLEGIKEGSNPLA